ncbi:MAG: hypothetical protein WC565_00230 [Parcubacteria group bacterium]
MSKIFIIIGIVIAIIAAGAGVYIYIKNSADGGSEMTITESLNELIASNKSVTCTVLDNTSGSEIDYKIYVTEGKIRQDQTISSDGETLSNHSLIKDGYAYTWETGSNNGVKIYVGDMSDQSFSDSRNINIDFVRGFNMNCKETIDDYSVFELPSNITFQTFMDGSGEIQATSDQCAICDLYPVEEMKTDCRAQFKCQ